MDLKTVVTILTLLAALYPVLIGQEPVSKRLPALAQKPAVKHAAKAIAAVGLLAAAFLFFVVPRSEVIDWVPVEAGSAHTEPAGESQRLVLRWDEEQARYVSASLRSQDTFPTALAMVPTAAGIDYYVGSYGAGLFAKAGSGDWRALGLEEMVITAVTVAAPGELVAATNLGLFASRDGGLTWEERGPVRDLVTALAVDPERQATWLAGTLSGIYRSADGGNTWIGPYMQGEVVTALAFSTADPRRVFASVLGSALLRSDDGGQQWRTVYEVDTRGSMPLALDPRAVDTLYVGPGALGLLRSTDGGSNWESLGLEGFSISTILVPQVPGALVVGTDGGEGVFVSLDGGESWQNQGALQDPVLSIIEDPTSPGQLLASTRSHGLLRSSNLGRSWTAAGLDQLFTTSRLQVRDLAAFQDDPEHLLAITYQKTALESRDGGRSWLQVPGLSEQGVKAFELINLAFADPREVILSANGSQLLRSRDGGESWSLISANLPREGYAPVAATGDGTLYAGPGGQGVWVLPAGEVVWQRTGLSAGSIEGLWVTSSGGDLLALDAGGRLLRSHDGGQTWAQVDYHFESLAASPHDPRVLVGVTDQFEVVRSVNGGVSWTVAVTLPADTNLSGTRVEASTDYPARFYLTSGLDLRVSQDGGESWQAGRLPGRGRLFPANQGRLYFYQEGALHASDDDGRTWSEIQRATTVEDLVTTIALEEGTLLAQTPDNGILLSGDGGESWQPTSIGSGPNIFDLVLLDTVSGGTEVATLLEEGGRMWVMRTADGVLWTPQSLPPCGGSLSYLGRLTEADGGKRWQLLCSEPHSLLVVDPLSLARQTMDLPPRPFAVVDARIEPPQRAFVSGHTGIGEQQVYVTEDGGSHWVETIPPLESTSWHLNKDLRSDAVITVEQGMPPAGSFRIEWVAPALAYATWLLLTLLVLLFFFRQPLLRRLARDVRQALVYTFSPGAAGGHIFHPAFPWLVWPLLILLALFLVQGAGPASITAEVLERAGQSGAVQQLAALLRGLPVRLTTAAGTRFLALLLLTMGETALIVGAIAIVAVFLAWRSQPPSEPVLIPAMVSTGTVLLLGGVVLVTAGVLPAAYPAGKQAMLGLQPLDIFRLFQLFLFFRITAVALHVVAQRRQVSPLALGLAYLAATVVAVWAAQLLLVRFLPRYPVTGRSLANSFPLNTFILVNALAVAVYVARSLSAAQARLESA